MKTKIISMQTRTSWGLLNVLLTLMIIGCSQTTTPIPQIPKTKKIDHSIVASFSHENLNRILELAGKEYGINLPPTTYDYTVYKLTYSTNYKGKEITASGLVALPAITDKPLSMVSLQHGTITANKDAPTELNREDPLFIFDTSIAGYGLVSVIPDYIGFGSSAHLMHPYVVENLTASTVIDMLKAAKELVYEKKMMLNDKLFLMGYSQGGYSSMATHKYIEEKNVTEFNLIASLCGAGAYDLKDLQDYLFSQSTYSTPTYIAYLTQAYYVTYEWPENLSVVFQEPYASRIPDLFDGSNDIRTINSQLTNNISELINKEVKEEIDTNPAYKHLVDSIRSNSLTDWAPRRPLYMYHGRQDATVPYSNSEVTYQKLIQNGGNQEIIKLIPLEGTHFTAYAPYITEVITTIKALQ